MDIYGFMGNFGPWEYILIFMLVIAVIYKIAQKVGTSAAGGSAKTGNKGIMALLIIGIILLVVAVMANTAGTALYNEGNETWLVHDAEEGTEMMNVAGLVKSGSIVVGGIGFLLLALALFKKNSPDQGAIPAHTNIMILCPNCNSSNTAGAQFCNKCGADLIANKLPCPQCGSPNAKGSTFCNSCGSNLNQ